jgi:hypothetical protein
MRVCTFALWGDSLTHTMAEAPERCCASAAPALAGALLAPTPLAPPLVR